MPGGELPSRRHRPNRRPTRLDNRPLHSTPLRHLHRHRTSPPASDPRPPSPAPELTRHAPLGTGAGSGSPPAWSNDNPRPRLRTPVPAGDGTRDTTLIVPTHRLLPVVCFSGPETVTSRNLTPSGSRALSAILGRRSTPRVPRRVECYLSRLVDYLGSPPNLHFSHANIPALWSRFQPSHSHGYDKKQRKKKDTKVRRFQKRKRKRGVITTNTFSPAPRPTKVPESGSYRQEIAHHKPRFSPPELHLATDLAHDDAITKKIFLSLLP